MPHLERPEAYAKIKKNYPALVSALDEVGKAVRGLGPIDEKHAHLIQLAAAASARSQGAVHSHVRRALAAGATADEIHHAILLLTSTVGFPAVVAALCWADDIVGSGDQAH